MFSGFRRWNCYFTIAFTVRYVNESTPVVLLNYHALIIYYIFRRQSRGACGEVIATLIFVSQMMLGRFLYLPGGTG